MSDIIIKFRWFIIVGFVLLSVGMGLFIPSAETDPNLENFIPESIPSRVNTTKLEEIFGGSDMILLLFESDDILNRESLLRIKKISKKLKRVNGVEKEITRAVDIAPTKAAADKMRNEYSALADPDSNVVYISDLDKRLNLETSDGIDDFRASINMACRSSTAFDGVAALGFEVELFVKSRYAVYSAGGDAAATAELL